MTAETLAPPRKTVHELIATANKQLGPLYREADVGKVAWQILLRDGNLVPVYGEYAMAPGSHLAPEQRAQALREHVPSPFVAAGLTAAWVYCGTGALPQLELAYRQGASARPKINGTVWSAVGLDTATTYIGGLRITDSNRTMADLATRHEPDTARKWITEMLAAGADLGAARFAMDRRYRVLGRRRAQLLFDEIAATQAGGL